VIADWLPEIPALWQWSKIGNIADVVRGASPRPKGDPRYFGGDIPWIKIADVSREPGKYLTRTREGVTPEGASKSRLLPAGSLILSNSGTVCVPKILGMDGCIHDGFVAFPTLQSSVSKDFLYYWFEFIRPWIIQENKQGVTQVNLNTAIVRDIDVPLLPLNEQTCIVAKIEELFSDLDAGVAALERAKANLKRYRAAVLKAAVEGKLTEEWRKGHPDVEPASDLLQRILVERRKRWEKEQLAKYEAKGKKPPKNWREKYKRPAQASSGELGELPEGWCWASVDMLATAISYGFTASAVDRKSGPRFLRITDIQGGAVNWDAVPSCDIKPDLSSKYRLQRGDILFARTGATVGKSFRVEECPEAIFASFLIRLQISKAVCPEYVFQYFQTTDYWRQIERKKRGVGQPGVNATVLSELVLSLPSQEEQQEIVQIVAAELSRVDATLESLRIAYRRSARLRQGVLRRAFHGRLT